MKYNRFFNIHIPKTGGTHFTENMLPSMNKILNDNRIKTSPQTSEDTKHWCWFEPFISDQTYIYTTLRDPVERLVSQFCWQAISAITKTNTPYTEEDINKKSFYKWLEHSDGLYKNVQSKSLVYNNKDLTLYKSSSNLSWEKDDIPKMNHFMFTDHFKNFIINEETLNKNIKRINFIVKTKDMSTIHGQQKIIDKILNDLDINITIEKNKIKETKTNSLANPLSKKVFNDLENWEIDNLYKYQGIDSEIYFSDLYTKY